MAGMTGKEFAQHFKIFSEAIINGTKNKENLRLTIDGWFSFIDSEILVDGKNLNQYLEDLNVPENQED